MPRRSTKPSFVKSLKETDFSERLRVAPAFFEKQGLSLPTNAKLRFEGGTWNVKLEIVESGVFCFSDGWANFAQDLRLRLQDFLVFSLLRESEFDVSVYDQRCNEKDISNTTLDSGTETTMSTRSGKKPRRKPSFFKVLQVGDFTKLLRVAPAFFRKHGLTPPNNAMLRIQSCEWDVKIETLQNDLVCFTNGWTKFALDCGLQFKEYLVFSLVRDFEFSVTIYDTSFCAREIIPQLPFNTHLNSHGASVIKKRKRGACKTDGSTSRTHDSAKESELCYYEFRLKKSQTSRVFLPKKFWAAAGLKEKKSVKLKYVGNNGRCIDVVLDRQQHRIDLVTGWPEFRRMNMLQFEKTYSFRFNHIKNVIHVHEVI